ncbi:putative transport protein [Chlamydia trachomatis]|nr:putative transport protein [Chlamydia trachomatis]
MASLIGAILIEILRARGRTGSDVALAMLFYGGIAGGVILIRIAGGSTTNLTSYLFGSIATVSTADIWYTIGLATVILLVGIGLRGPLFTLSYDPEFSRARGLRVGMLNICIAMLAALTVSVSMRVVGVLLVSAIMIVPVAIAQLIANSFRGTMHIAMAIGAIVCVTGLIITYIYPFSPGAMIVVLAVCLYLLTAIIHPLWQRFHRENRH